MNSSQFGYKTTAPLPREAQAVLSNRDQREKTRAAMGDMRAPTNPLQNHAVSAGFASETERFSRHIPEALNEFEASRRNQKANIIEGRKSERLDRERQRIQKMDDEQKKYERDAAAIAGTGMRNKGSVGYNLISGSWGSSLDAARAKYQDDRIEYSAKLRTNKLDTRGNSNYNILTGETRNSVVIPPVPTYLPPL